MPLALFPLSAQPQAPLRVSVGDAGNALVCVLVGGDGGYVYLPVGSTVAFEATELGPAPVKERRPPRTISGAAAIDGTYAYLVSYTLQASDTATAGQYQAALVVTSSGEVDTFPAGLLSIE